MNTLMIINSVLIAIWAICLAGTIYVLTNYDKSGAKSDELKEIEDLKKQNQVLERKYLENLSTLYTEILRVQGRLDTFVNQVNTDNETYNQNTDKISRDITAIYRKLGIEETDGYLADEVTDSIWAVRDKRTKSQMNFNENQVDAEVWLTYWLNEHPDEDPENYEVVETPREE